METLGRWWDDRMGRRSKASDTGTLVQCKEAWSGTEETLGQLEAWSDTEETLGQLEAWSDTEETLGQLEAWLGTEETLGQLEGDDMWDTCHSAPFSCSCLE